MSSGNAFNTARPCDLEMVHSSLIFKSDTKTTQCGKVFIISVRMSTSTPVVQLVTSKPSDVGT